MKYREDVWAHAAGEVATPDWESDDEAVINHFESRGLLASDSEDIEVAIVEGYRTVVVERCVNGDTVIDYWRIDIFGESCDFRLLESVECDSENSGDVCSPQADPLSSHRRVGS